MKILFLCHRFPYPPDHGARIRAYYFIRHLSQKHSVIVGTLAQSEQELAEGEGLKESCEEVIAEILPRHIRWFQALIALPSSCPSSTAYFWSTKLKKRLDDILASQKFDLVFVFCAFMAQYVLECRGGFRVLDYGDIDSAKWSEYSRYKRFPLSWGYFLESVKLRNYERGVSEKFDHCTVISESELEEFKRIGITVPCSIISNGVDTDYFCPNPTIDSESSVIVFLGRMDYFPNVDGITYFAKEVFPLISSARPGVKLCIVGSNPTKSVKELAAFPNVSITGYVPDVRSFLGGAAVSVVPLRIARGTQNKILESMAMGIPVVTTAQAAKGVGSTVAEHLLVADSAVDFAKQVIAVLDDKELRVKLSEAGRRQIENTYVWSVSLKKLDALLAERKL
jgi:polysaccharide biosynthesis protein PslH